MHIVEVIPIGRGMPASTLSYFSSRPYERGALVTIRIRARDYPAIVTSTQDAFSMKAALRAATFSLRRISEQEPRGYLSTRFMETAEAMADYHATTLGSVLFSMLPKEIRDGLAPLPQSDTRDHLYPVSGDKPIIFQATEEHRFHEYERMIRECFAQKRSFLCVVPSVAYSLPVYERLAKGIEQYTVLLNGSQTTPMLRKAFATLNDPHPLFIIATPGYACLERQDIGTVVLEYERSGGYVGKTRPYLDFRKMLEDHSMRSGRRFILAGSVLRSDVIALLRTNDAIPYEEETKRLELESAISVIDMKPDSDGTTPFALFSPELIKALQETLSRKRRVFLYSARRGLAPLVACIDCGHILRDPNSGAPLSLERRTVDGKEERWLVSSVSGYRAPANDLCPKCGSWRLRERGIGIQQVYDELRKHLRDVPLILFDHITANTERKAANLAKEFYAEKRAVMLGTALAIPRLTEPVYMSAVVSHDALRAIPSWRQQEEMFATLLTLREKTSDTVYVQTRSEDDVFEMVRRGQVGDFYAQELALRETYQYPPYSVFVHFTWQQDDGKLKAHIGEQFAPYNISLYSSPHVAEESGIEYGLLRIPRENWPNPEIVERIRALPPNVRVMINPDRIV